MHKILRKIGIGVLVIGAVLLTAFGFKKQEEIKCYLLDVELKVDAAHALTSEAEITQAIRETGMTIEGASIENVDVKKIKTILDGQALLKNTTVHKTVDGKVKVYAEQRIPFIRIINEHGAQFLIDQDGVKMPCLSSGNPRLMLFTGRINDYLDGTTLELLQVNENLRNSTILDEIFQVATYIESSDFWQNQVEHVYVNAEQEFELIPRVGDQVILLGEAENIEDKLTRLEVFYKETIGKKNWNQYATLDLRFDDQVVCKEKNY